MSSVGWAIVPAAGRGARLPGDVPKQYRNLAGACVLDRAIDALRAVPLAGIVVALAPDDLCWSQTRASRASDVHVVTGGAERADSVMAALRWLEAHAPDCEAVLVHDAARALLPAAALQRLVAQAPGADGALLAIPAQDTVKQAAGDGRVEATLDRSRLWLAQTPQYFERARLTAALAAALERGSVVTDEASAMEVAGFRPRLLAGDPFNLKITTSRDLRIAQALLEGDACV